MEIFNWIFFVISIISYLFSFFLCLHFISEKDEDGVLFSFTANFITIGLLFYSSLTILNVSVTMIFLWITLALSSVLSLFILYTFFSSKNKYNDLNFLHKLGVIIIGMF